MKSLKTTSFSLKLFNLAVWTEIVLSVFLPFKTDDGFTFFVGFPFTFLRVYNVPLNDSPFNSMGWDPVAFLINSIIIYIVFDAAIKGCRKLWSICSNKRAELQMLQ